MAEALARHKIGEGGREPLIGVGSAGTHAYHVGERPDSRTLSVCSAKGISTQNLMARQIAPADFQEFDLILGMDQGHVERILNLAPKSGRAEIAMMMEFAGLGKIDVPDPYYGGIDGFYQIYQMLDEAITLSLQKIIHN